MNAATGDICTEPPPPDHLLIRADLVPEQIASLPANARAQLHDVSTWLQTTIARPSLLVGRKGDMCPFVRLGLDRFQSIFFHVYQGELDIVTVQPVLRALL